MDELKLKLKIATAGFLAAGTLLLSGTGFSGVMDTTLRAGGRQESISALGEQTLELRGRGIFRYLRMKLSAASFYTLPSARTTEEVLGPVPKRLNIRYFRKIPKDAITQSAEKNLKNNPEVNYAKIEQRVKELHACYQVVDRGDEYELVYFQGKTSLYFNRQLKIVIDGDDFAKAYFGIWLSKYSINQKLRKELLGGGR